MNIDEVRTKAEQQLEEDEFRRAVWFYKWRLKIKRLFKRRKK